MRAFNLFKRINRWDIVAGIIGCFVGCSLAMPASKIPVRKPDWVLEVDERHRRDREIAEERRKKQDAEQEELRKKKLAVEVEVDED